MLSPTAAIAAQMDALQMNDWPDMDAGIRTAFLFSKPFGCEGMIAGRVRTCIYRLGRLHAHGMHYPADGLEGVAGWWLQGTPSECHSWQGSEVWVPFEAFRAALHLPPLHVLLGCESWKVCARMRDTADCSTQGGGAYQHGGLLTPVS